MTPLLMASTPVRGGTLVETPARVLNHVLPTRPRLRGLATSAPRRRQSRRLLAVYDVRCGCEKPAAVLGAVAVNASLDACLVSARGLGSLAPALALGLELVLGSLERRTAAFDVDGRQHIEPYALACSERAARARHRVCDPRR